MNFRILQTPTRYDIPIASVQIAEVRSHHMMYGQSMTQAIEGNAIAAMSSTVAYPNLSGVLSVPHSFGPIELTDEYYYDYAKGVSEPLWYRHAVTKSYYNPSAVTRSTKVTVRGGHHDTDGRIVLKPGSGNYLVVRDTVSISFSPTPPGDPALETLYSVDYGAGVVVLSLPDPATTYTLSISCELISLDVVVTASDGSLYRPECTRMCPDVPGYYMLSLLSTGQRPLTISYRTRSSSSDLGEYEETATVEPLFIEAEVDTVLALQESDAESQSKRVYSQSRSGRLWYVRSTSLCPAHQYTLRPARPGGNIVDVVEPKARSHRYDWPFEIMPGSFDTGDGRTFSLGSHIPYLRRRKEEARYVDSLTIAASQPNLVTPIGISGELIWVKVEEQDGTEIPTVGYNPTYGTISLGRSITPGDRLLLSYTHLSSSKPLSSVSFNPVLDTPAIDGYPIRDVVVAFYAVDSRYGSEDQAVFAKALPRFVGHRAAVYSYDTLDAQVNGGSAGARATYRSSIPFLPPALYATSGGLATRVEVLGTCFVSDPLDADGYLVEDARTFGGGITQYTPDCYDHSYFDGEIASLDSKVVVTIPLFMYTSLRSRMLEWDPEVVANEYPDAVVDQYVMRYINDCVKRFVLPSVSVEVRIGA